MRKELIAIGIAVLVVVVGVVVLAAQCGDDQPDESNDRPLPCAQYAEIIVSGAKVCQSAFGGLRDAQWVTTQCRRNQQGGSKLNLQRCRAQVPTMDCATFAEGGFVDACFD